ncbi:hypothetical protein HZH68_005508 [Vespula germanica]|uniref:Uncharacterized protein n=1 Tax=Vespula germanica TaxID=30212 RepID=A0A834KJU5_VESGE|nr:hypothetical protein HZH68_005508 [Vespula germanica]
MRGGRGNRAVLSNPNGIRIHLNELHPADKSLETAGLICISSEALRYSGPIVWKVGGREIEEQQEGQNRNTVRVDRTRDVLFEQPARKLFHEFYWKRVSTW